MSKCDITFEFDRDNRTYHGGETVSGNLRIRINEDLNCNGIKFLRFWKTHGRGNTETGNRHEEMLAGSGRLTTGETLEYPFEFVCDCHPVTYHGNYINIDHYVRVEVDVPWAIDPKFEEEFIVLPGERPPQMTGRRDEIIKFEPEASQVTSPGAKFAVALIFGVVVVIFSVFAFMLVPFLLIGGAIYWSWKKAIESRVGNVEVKTQHVVVTPGEMWPLELAFTPRKSFKINGISVKLLGRESAVSGSGSNKTTHRHTLFEETYPLQPAGRLLGGEPVRLQVELQLPETDAFSFDGSSNDVEWSAQVRIDMPAFPDWSQRLVLQMVPREFLEMESAAEFGVEDSYDARQALAADQTPPTSRAEFEGFAEESAGTGELLVATEYPSIEPLLAQISEAGRFGQERLDIVTAAHGQVYQLDVEINRIVSTFGSQAGAGYHNGKTITGTVAGTGETVQIFTRDSSNLQLEQLSRGDQWRTPAMVHAWDSLYNRLILVEADI